MKSKSQRVNKPGVVCVHCGKWAFNSDVPESDPCWTTLIGSIFTGFHNTECYCGHCVKILGEDYFKNDE